MSACPKWSSWSSTSGWSHRAGVSVQSGEQLAAPQRGECLWRDSTGHIHREENTAVIKSSFGGCSLVLYFQCHTFFFFPQNFFLSFKSQILLILKVTWCFRYHLHSRVHMSLCENLLTHILVISGYYVWKSWGRQACIHCLNPNVPFYFYNWECCLTWSSLFLSVKITKQRIIGRTKYVGRKEVYHIL